MNQKTKISVVVITYNQQETIGQTLDSILVQKGDFDLELVIGEDCSKDRTPAICADYAERYPNIIRLLPNTHNLGIMANTARVFNAATGDYISIIAGDDYYSDENALEKQFRYMQNHPEVGVLAANGYNYYVQRDIKKPGLNPVLKSGQDQAKAYYFSTLHLEGVYLAPVGMMFRAELLHKYIDFDEMLRRRLPVEDYPIQAIMAQHTKFACLPDLLVTYRVYKESATFITYNHPKFLEYYRGLVDTRRYLNELFPNDAVSEKLLQERLFIKEFQYDVYHMKYRDARRLIEAVSPEMAQSDNLRSAKRYTCCWILFAAYHYYKRRMIEKSIRRVI